MSPQPESNKLFSDDKRYLSPSESNRENNQIYYQQCKSTRGSPSKESCDQGSMSPMKETWKSPFSKTYMTPKTKKLYTPMHHSSRKLNTKDDLIPSDYSKIELRNSRSKGKFWFMYLFLFE